MHPTQGLDLILYPLVGKRASGALRMAASPPRGEDLHGDKAQRDWVRVVQSFSLQATLTVAIHGQPMDNFSGRSLPGLQMGARRPSGIHHLQSHRVSGGSRVLLGAKKVALVAMVPEGEQEANGRLPLWPSGGMQPRVAERWWGERDPLHRAPGREVRRGGWGSQGSQGKRLSR